MAWNARRAVPRRLTDVFPLCYICCNGNVYMRIIVYVFANVNSRFINLLFLCISIIYEFAICSFCEVI